MVDLCCGLGGWQAPFEDHGWDTVGLDLRDDLEADVIGDVRHLPLDCDPVLVTASPPCTEVSRYRLPWFHGGAHSGPVDLELFEACLDSIEWLGPRYWVLENVQGLHDFYGEPSKKVGPYWLWGEFPPFDAPRGSHRKYKIWGGDEDAAERRAKIPYPIADGLRHAVEVWGT